MLADYFPVMIAVFTTAIALVVVVLIKKCGGKRTIEKTTLAVGESSRKASTGPGLYKSVAEQPVPLVGIVRGTPYYYRHGRK